MHRMRMMFEYIIKPFTLSSCCNLWSSINKPTIRLVSPFRAQLLYLLFISFLGYLALICTPLRLGPHLGSLDAAFMSISAVTSSSMSTVEMEVFTSAQLVYLTLLMLLGGEVFISMLGLFLQTSRLSKALSAVRGAADDSTDNCASLVLAELGQTPNDQKTNFDDHTTSPLSLSKQKAVKTLAYLVLAYIVVIHVCGSLFVYIYMITVPSATHVLKAKSIFPSTFSIFLTTSSFANCGFVPINENMAIFKTNTALLLLIIPQVLMGNTFYPIGIRVLIQFMESLTSNNTSSSTIFTYILSNSSSVGYKHLMSSTATWWLGWTRVGFLVSQVVMLICMDWDSQAFDANMTWFQKLAACLFQSVSSRHSGESVFDLSALSTAVLVLFILMMYFPPYLTFMPDQSGQTISSKVPAAVEELSRGSFESDKENKNKKLIITDNFMLSQLSYLAIFVILILITERKSLKTDPFNFSVLNIVLEVVSAYGNVGFSMGYSCKRQIQADSFCEEKTYGFAGRWTKEGKLILIVVMIFGKLKSFNQKGGKAWKTL